VARLIPVRFLFAAVAVAGWLAVCSCVNIPTTYAPPIQRKPILGPEVGDIGHFIAMSDARAPAHIVRDISEAVEGGSWRWTRQYPTLRFVLPTTKNLSLVMDFSISNETFVLTGPIVISWWVNGRLLDKVRYDSPGEKHFQKPVDASWLKAGADTVVTAELDKVWVAPDGAKLGIILTRGGFQQ